MTRRENSLPLSLNLLVNPVGCAVTVILKMADPPDPKAISYRVCQVLVPVTVCSLYVTILVKLIESDAVKSENIMSKAWSRLGMKTSSEDGQAIGEAMLGSLYLVLMFLALIVVVTLIILFVLYMEWHSCLSYYFYVPSFIIMAIISPIFLRLIGKSLGWFSLDLISLAILTWNFTALGMMAIFGLYASGPLILQQLYLIHNSSIVALLMISFLPGWAPWILLAFLVVWDLFAVMTPCGPLNLIINMAEKRGIVEMPGLVYSTDLAPGQEEESQSEEPRTQADGRAAQIEHRPDAAGRELQRNGTVEQEVVSPDRAENQNSESSKRSESTMGRTSIEERGVDIGLGDFTFYGLLIGITAKGETPGEYYTTLSTLISVLIGLIATLAILVLTRRALPALPISIALGLITAGLSMQFISPLADHLAYNQVFI